MPLNEYHCQQCGEDFEKLVRMSEPDARPVCPRCKSHETQKRLSTFAPKSGTSGWIAMGNCGSTGGFS